MLSKYELLGLISRDDECKTYKARDTSNSSDVIIHVLSGASQIKSELSGIVENLLKTGGAPWLLFAGQFEGDFYVVTEFRPEYEDLRKCLQARTEPPLAAAAPDDRLNRAQKWKTPPLKTTTAAEPGEFTRMFKTNPQIDVPAEPGISKGNEGEFTKLFKTLPSSTQIDPPVLPPSPAPVNTGPLQEEKAIGEFTRMFKASGSAPSPAPGSEQPVFPLPSAENPLKLQDPWDSKVATVGR